MRSKKGRRLKKSMSNIGCWLKRYYCKRTCRCVPSAIIDVAEENESELKKIKEKCSK